MSMPVSNLPISRPKSLCATAVSNEAVSFSGSRISGIILRSSSCNCSKALLRWGTVGWHAAATALSNCSLPKTSASFQLIAERCEKAFSTGLEKNEPRRPSASAGANRSRASCETVSRNI